MFRHSMDLLLIEPTSGPFPQSASPFWRASHPGASSGRLTVWAAGLICILMAPAVRAGDTRAGDTEAEQPEIRPLLTVDRIYGGQEFAVRAVRHQWLPDGHSWLTLKKADRSTSMQIVRVNAATGEESVLVDAELLKPDLEESPLFIDGFELSANGARLLLYTNAKRVWRRKTRGDYWVFDLTSHELRKLGGHAAPSTLMFAQFSPDARSVAYVCNRNIFVEDLLNGKITQLTSTDSSDIINGTFDWVYEEELGLRNGFRWSPDGRSIAYWQISTEGVRRIPLVDNLKRHYPEVLMLPYPRTGHVNSVCRLGVVDVAAGTTRWLPVPGDPRDHYIARMDWIPSSHDIVFQQLNRLQNTNRVMIMQPNDKLPANVLTEQDDAWVDVHDEMFWLHEESEFTWLSERDGWRHLYIVSRNGKQMRQVTSGKFDVIELLHVDEARSLAYFIASPQNPTERYLYSIQLDGKNLRRLTPDSFSGTHQYSISADGRFAIHSQSSFNTPPSTDLVSLPDHSHVRDLELNDRLRRAVAELQPTPTEFFRVEIDDGVQLDAWCIHPAEADPEDTRQKFPLLVYVYGEPAGQTVLNRWGGTTQLWHRMLAQQGCAVMSIDNRGTPAPRGRAWRKSVYRQVGTLGPNDQAAALRQILESRPRIDRQRIGIWGWSGGGSSSLHAIFRFPDLYRTAISVAPVPNQRYYDTIYQERYMGLPTDNVWGYRNGSAINFAHQLQGNLLLIHGTGDDNCHYQTTELLIQELVRHNRQFQMMAYPSRTHAIREGTNTTRHLRTLMTDYLQRYLLTDPSKPAAEPAESATAESRRHTSPSN